MNINKAEIAAVRAARKRGQAGQAGTAVLLALVIIALVALGKGWALMVAWGIAAATLGVATIAFWPAVAVALLLSLAFGTNASVSTNS